MGNERYIISSALMDDSFIRNYFLIGPCFMGQCIGTDLIGTYTHGPNHFSQAHVQNS